MSDTINIGGITVSKFYLGGSSDVKIYLGTTKLYPHLQEPCFAVVDNISTYTARTYVDVYETSSDKWYKLNNLSAYEEYGVYGSSTATTYYDGKLVIQDNYEYQYSSGSWNNVGEVSGSSRVPQGYTEVEYVENTTSAYINTGVYLYDSTTNSYTIQCKHYFQPYGSDFEYLFGTEGTSSPYIGVTFRYYRRNIQYASNPDNVSWTHIDNGDGTSGITASCSSTTATNGNNPLTLFCGLWSTGPWRYGRGKIYSFKVTKNNGLIRDFVPAKRDSDDKYGMYDLVTETFYTSPNGNSFSGGAVTGGTIVYPMYYETKQDPPDNVTFSSMTEAEEYECPWVGMEATIDGDRYIFSGDSQSGYSWVKKLTAWYTLQDLINTHTVVSLGNNRYNFSPEVNGIAFFRVHTDKVSGSDTYVDLYNDNLPSPPYFGIKDDNEIGLYTSVDGYINLKDAANSTSCTWAYWVDANTIEVNAQAIMNDTMNIGYYNGSFSKLLLSFELPII